MTLLAEQMRALARHAMSKNELAVRAQATRRVARAVEQAVPGATVHLFGSSATGLALPGADVDLLVCDSSLPPSRARHRQRDRRAEETLRVIHRDLKASPEFTNNLFIQGAKVPILKLVDTKAGLPFDLSCNAANGLYNSEAVTAVLRSSPVLVPTLLVFKAFLKQFGFHQTFNGGVGSYLAFSLAACSLFGPEWEGRVRRACRGDMKKMEPSAAYREETRVDTLVRLKSFMWSQCADGAAAVESVSDGALVGALDSMLQLASKRNIWIKDALDSSNQLKPKAYRWPEISRQVSVARRRLKARECLSSVIKDWPAGAVPKSRRMAMVALAGKTAPSWPGLRVGEGASVDDDVEGAEEVKSALAESKSKAARSDKGPATQGEAAAAVAGKDARGGEGQKAAAAAEGEAAAAIVAKDYVALSRELWSDPEFDGPGATKTLFSQSATMREKKILTRSGSDVEYGYRLKDDSSGRVWEVYGYDAAALAKQACFRLFFEDMGRRFGTVTRRLEQGAGSSAPPHEDAEGARTDVLVERRLDSLRTQLSEARACEP